MTVKEGEITGIRPVREEDLAVIETIEKACFPGDPWSYRVLFDASVHPDTVFLVARGSARPISGTTEDRKDTEDASAIAGYIVLTTVAGEGSIDNICVEPAYRGQGIARALIEEAMRLAYEQHDASEYTLEVRISNTAARMLYEALGFENEGIRPRYYTGPAEDAVIYRKKELKEDVS
ncbi:MAG: ribosomal protein S18-alanine N-acetyltransferase [Lachnospiraceae bacterium]|nr:ribosomal protein S18-alanine N-acetyltransferase [Lachnospiraceae bacterium]